MGSPIAGSIAITTHVIAQNGAFPIVFSIVFGALAWLGLFLRNERLRAALCRK